MSLTPAGQEFYLEAKRFADFCARRYQDAIPEIRIGAIQGVLENWLVEKLCTFEPNILPNLNLQIMSDQQIGEALLAGSLDFGLSTVRIENESISSRKIFEENFCLISRDPVKPDDVHGERWISGPRASYLGRLSKKTSPRFLKVNSTDAIQRLVAAGLGVAVLPEHVLKPEIKLHKSHRIRVKSGVIYLSMPNYRMVPEHLASFLKRLRI